MYPQLLELGVINIYSYGVLVAAAYLIGLQVAVVRGRSRGLDPNRLMGLGIAIFVAALVGAKLLLFVVEFDYFTSDVANLWMLVRSAGVFYGGFVLAVVVAFWYMRRHDMPVWTTCDAFAPGIAVGQAVGGWAVSLRAAATGGQRTCRGASRSRTRLPRRTRARRSASACTRPSRTKRWRPGDSWRSAACRTARHPVSGVYVLDVPAFLRDRAVRHRNLSRRSPRHRP